MAPLAFHQTFTGRTCLKWSADGSLSEHDHQELMKRLCLVDPVLAETEVCPDETARSQAGDPEIPVVGSATST